MTTKAKKFPAGSKSRLDSESLSSSLRLSWRKGDLVQAAETLSELSLLYPDLLVALSTPKSEPQVNYYDTLNLEAAATQQEVITGFFKQLRRVLKDKGMSKRSRNYVRLLDAVFVLRKPRLRLSHDLAAVSSWLKANGHNGDAKGIADFGVMDGVAKAYAKGIASASIQSKNLNVTASQPQAKDIAPRGEAATEVPMLLKLLTQSGLVSEEKASSLHKQMKQIPDVDLAVLLIRAGYVSEGELASVKLAEMLINSGKVSFPQVLVALYDERTSGLRMAESLQTRGWLAVKAE